MDTTSSNNYSGETTPTFAPAADQSNYAGFWKRFAAWIIDNVILVPAWLLVFLYPLVRVLYFTLMESSSHQATLGKKILGIKVTTIDGKKLTFGQAFGRYMAQILDMLPLGFGFIMAGLSVRKQAFHDLIIGTLVVNKDNGKIIPS